MFPVVASQRIPTHPNASLVGDHNVKGGVFIFTPFFMFIWTIILLLIFVLFYFHLTAQYKKPREPFEIYETRYESRDQLDTLNGQRQPFLFKIDDLCPLTYTTTLAELAQDSTVVSLVNGDGETTIIPMPLKECISMVSYHPNYTCFGGVGGGTTMWNTIAEEFDEILAPSMIPFMFSSQLSIMCGSAGAYSVPEYHTQTAKYIVVLGGGDQNNITIKLTSLRNYEKLNGGKCGQKCGGGGTTRGGTQYTQFSGAIDIWNTEQNIKLQKIPFLEFNVGVGYAISIPPFTVWSIKYDNAATIVFSVDYISFMNSIANIGNWWQSNPFNDCDTEAEAEAEADTEADTLKGDVMTTD